MCGINGLYYFSSERPVEADVVHAMRKVAVHRGPDDHGTFIRGNVGLGFNRLSIIDLSGGHQPMTNEDESVCLVFNGEIYNFVELRDELIGRGCTFRTRSDTEVILRAWEEFGESCVERLRGMFGFAIWDARRQVLFIARDRLGIKPLFYYHDAKRLAFASELKSVLEVPGIPVELNEDALEEFLRRRYVIAPHTFLKNVWKLQPGHALLASAGGVKTWRYWDVPADENLDVTEAEAIETIERMLDESMRLHLVADVPLGAFLSGGLDSSCVVGLMHKLGVEKIKTFSIGYDTPESELAYAKVVADHFRTEHHELVLTPMAFRDVLPKIVWHMDEPIGDQACIPLLYLSEFARRHVTVVLSGEGSDEIFSGYPIYNRMLQFESMNRAPLAGTVGRALSSVAGDSKVRKYADMLGKPLEWRYGGVGGLFSAKQALELLGGRRTTLDGVAEAYRRCKSTSALQRMAYVDLQTWLPDDLLSKADRMTMAHSLELRVPFLDHPLVEYASRLPRDLKLKGGVTKYLLKKSAEKLLPREIVYRSKKGFPVPTRSWFRGDLAGFARETLLANDGAMAAHFSRDAIERVLKAHQREDRSEQIFSLLVFDNWYRQFVQRPAPVGA